MNKKGIKKYQAGADAVPTTFSDKASAFMGSNGSAITSAAGSLMPLLMKKPDPNAKPYKKGTNLIKYQQGNKKTKVLPDTGSSFEITMDDLADSTLGAKAKGQSASAKSNENTNTSEDKNKPKQTKGVSTGKQAAVSGAVGALGAGLRSYGESGPGKLKSVSKAVGNLIKYASPLVSATESVRKNIDTKTGDISYGKALGQFLLDQAAGKAGGASVRIPYKTASRTMKQVDDVIEDMAKRKETLVESKKASKAYYNDKKSAIKADADADANNLKKYKEDFAKFEINKTRNKKAKPPVKPEPSTFNQKEFAKKEKPSLQYGERVNIKSIPQIAKEAASEEFKAPALLKKIQEYRKDINAGNQKTQLSDRQKEINLENRRTFRKLENTFGLSEKEFLGKLKKSGKSIEDFYQDLMETSRSKGISTVGEQRRARKPVVDLTEKLKEKRQLPERKKAAQEKVINKEATKNQQKLITYKNQTEEQKATAIQKFKENRKAPITFTPERTRRPVEDITPTPRKSQLLLPESPVTIERRANKKAKAKATRESNTLKKEQEAARSKAEAEALAAKQAKQEKAAATRAANKEKQIDEKVKKIKFYGTGK